jgi:murein DD-endopeptidase MepM/ murein hydrolase activator NlpD
MLWALLALTLPVCGLEPPVPGPVVAPFAPNGAYAGHWGADLAAPPGSNVRGAGAGTVVFSGAIAGRLSITVDHGGGVRTSYSYLSSLMIHRGAVVEAGEVIGISGFHGAHPSVHVSLRLGERYVDPVPRFSCPPSPAGAVFLLPT